MDPHAPQSLLTPLHRLLAAERRRHATDRDLLRAFVQHNEDDAFAELLRRHGPMVLRLALHLLHHRQDAEDVFQAAFLTLARKACSLRKESSVAGWLHRVAWRLCVRSRAARKRTAGVSRLVEGRQPADAGRSPDPADEIGLRESQEILHQELAALPERLRVPLVLCYLEGRTRDEAAHRLGWSLGTLKRRLEQGRKLLHARLSRRGVTLSAALSASLLVSTEVSASLAECTLGLATSTLAGSANVPAAVAGLLAKASWSAKVKAVWGLVLLLGACAGAGAWVYQKQGGAPAAPSAEAPQANKHPVADKGEKSPAPARDHFGDPLPPGALARMGTVRFRHGDVIEGISLSSDGRILATASRDRTVRLWDMATGRELHRLPGHAGPDRFGSHRFVAFSPQGKVLATGVSPFGPIRLWDAATGKQLRKLEDPTWNLGHLALSLGHLAFSADGKTVAAGASHHCIAVWDSATGRLLHQLDGDEKDLTIAVPIAFSPDGRLLASGGQGEEIRLWDLKTGKEQRRFTVPPPLRKEKNDRFPHRGRVKAVAFSPDGLILASAAIDSPVRLWNVSTGKVIRSLPGYRFGANALAFSPDGKTLASGEGSDSVRVWETVTGKEVRRIEAHRWVADLAFVRDGKTLVTGDSAIRLWDIRNGTEILTDRGHSARIVSSVLSADGRTLTTASADGGIRWWDLATGKELRRLACLAKSFSDFGAVDLSPNGAIAAYYTEKMVGEHEAHVGIELWDLIAQKKRVSLWRPNIMGSHFSPDGKTLYTHGWDVSQKASFILCLDTATGKELRTLVKIPNGFEYIPILSTDGKLLAGVVRGQEKFIYLWDTATGKEVCRVPAGSDFNDPCFVAISPDNKLLAVADGPRLRPDSRVMHQHIHLWVIATGKEIRRFGRSTRGYWAAAFSGDGKTLATTGEDYQIRLWETATGGERLHLSGHAGQIGKLIFAENDRTLISTSSDTTALVWDLAGTRRPIHATDRERSSPRMQVLWSALAAPDAAASYRAMCRLIAAPADALALLRRRLKPIEDVDEKRIERLIADLDAEVFAVREKATEELRKLGELAGPALRKALASRPTLEMRRRVQGLLDDISPWRPSADILRQLRAIEVLERLGTPEARKLLETLAGGAAGARQTREAKAAVRRLRSTRSAKPQENRP